MADQFDSDNRLLRQIADSTEVAVAAIAAIPVGPFLPLAGGTMIGSILFTDNAVDLGATGATRPRSLFLGTSAIIQRSAFGATPTDGLQLANSTPAALGAQQFSSAIHFSGNGWATGVAASQDVSFRIYAVPVQDVNATGALNFDISLNGGAFATAASLDWDGTFHAGALDSASNITTSATGDILFLGRSHLRSSVDGVIELFNNAVTDFSRLSFGGTSAAFPALRRTGAQLDVVSADATVFLPIQAKAFYIGGQVLNFPLSVYATGTAYTLTAVNAKVDFGTTDPALVITQPGTYMLTGSVKIALVGATFAANQTVTVLIRRTNNTPANIANTTFTYTVPIVTTITQTLAIVNLNEVHYATVNADDNLEIWADVSATPSVGSIQISAAHVTAVRVAGP
jgi:hypothetical protein